MKNGFLKSVVLVLSIFALIGCGSGSSGVPDTKNVSEDPTDGEITLKLPTSIEDAMDAPKSTLSQEVKDALAYMYSEEGLAHDVYLNIYTIQKVNQLQNIATKSEVKHIEAVNQLAIKYDLNMTQYPDTDVPYSIEGINSGKYPVEHIQELYNELYDKGVQSKKDALEVGCMVEVVDINDLDKYIGYAQNDNASDVLEVFNFLRNGSYAHYWAFDSGLKNSGIANGCCSLGTEWCHPEYPKK